MNKQIRADIMLVMVTLCWGISYYLMDIAMTEMGPFMLNAYRFLGAFFVAGVLSFKRLKSINRETLKFCIIIGLIQVITYIGATCGVQHTTLSNSGFLCGLSVAFIPVIELVFLKRLPEKKVVVAVILSLIGIMLLTLKDDFSINKANMLGDMLCLMCAVSYGFCLTVNGEAVKKDTVDAYQIGVCQMFVTGIVMLILALIFEEPTVPHTKVVFGSVIFLSIFSTGVACILQTLAQQYTKTSHVGIIFTLEPIFSAITAFVLAGEVLTPKAYLGAFIMIFALLITEVSFDFKKKGL